MQHIYEKQKREGVIWCTYFVEKPQDIHILQFCMFFSYHINGRISYCCLGTSRFRVYRKSWCLTTSTAFWSLLGITATSEVKKKDTNQNNQMKNRNPYCPMSSKMMFVSLQIAQIPCCFFHHHHKGSLHSLILLLLLFLLLSCNRNYFYITSPCSVQVLLDPQNKQLQIMLFSTGKIHARRNFSLSLKGTVASPLHSQKSHYQRDI